MTYIDTASRKSPAFALCPPLSPDIRQNHAYMPIEVDEQEFGMSRDALYEKLKQYNVYSRRYFYPLVCDYACYRQRFSEGPLDASPVELLTAY